MLTTHQITALVLGILLPMILLCITAHVLGIRKGREQTKLIEFDKGYQAGLARQSQHILALQADICTLNTRVTQTAEARSLADEAYELARQQLAEAMDYMGALQQQAACMLPLVLTYADRENLRMAANLLGAAAKRFAKTGSNKTNHAVIYQNKLIDLLLRAAQTNWSHPDTDLIEWLDTAASVHADEEHGELRFPLAARHAGYPHVRDMIRDAHQQDAESMQNHQASLEAVA